MLLLLLFNVDPWNRSDCVGVVRYYGTWVTSSDVATVT